MAANYIAHKKEFTVTVISEPKEVWEAPCGTCVFRSKKCNRPPEVPPCEGVIYKFKSLEKVK